MTQVGLEKSFRNRLRQLDRQRRNKFHKLESGLYKFFCNNRVLQRELIKPEQAQRILIVRSNKRIGNMFFLLTFISAVRKAYPQATIDLLLHSSWQGKVFRNLDINQIHYSDFTYSRAIFLPKLAAALRKVTYDIAFMPFPSSTDRIFLGLAQAKNKVTLGSSKYAYVHPQHFERNHNYQHYALQPIELLQQMGFDLQASDFPPALAFDAAELEQAQAEYQQLIDRRAQHDQPVIAFFRGARGSKVISDQTWHEILAKFKQASGDDVTLVEILSPDIDTPLSAEALTYQNSNLRGLAAFLKQTDLFICGDTGPLHLAAAAGAHCVGLFTHTSPVQYGCLGTNTVNVDNLQTLDAQTILQALNQTKPAKEATDKEAA